MTDWWIDKMNQLKDKHIETLDIKNVLHVLRRRKWFCIVPFVVTSVVVSVGSRFLPPVYQSSTVVQIDRQVGLSTELQRALGIDRSFQTEEMRTDELRAYRNEVTSSYYLSRLADRLKLDQDSQLVRGVQSALAATPGLGADEARLYALRQRFANTITVTSVGANQVEIAVECPRPAEARDIANALGELFVSERLRQDLTSVRSSQDFTDVQLQKYENALRDKINERTNLERDFLQNRLDSSVASETNRSQIQTEINQTLQDISDNQETERSLLSQLATGGNISVSNLALTESEPLQRAKEVLKSQLRLLDDMLSKYSLNAPQMLNWRLEQNSGLSTIEREIERQVNVQFSSLSNENKDRLAGLFTAKSNLDYLVTKNEYLKASLDRIKDRIDRIPSYQAALEGLNREVVSFTELRDRFKRQQEGSAISQALLQDASTAKYRIVESALLPKAPIRPDRIRLSLFGILVGLAIGVSAVFVAELMDSSFRNPHEIEDELDLPVLGVIPKVPFLKQIRRD
jgi:succinoglycan biosynthesis transport protein ExoP